MNEAKTTHDESFPGSSSAPMHAGRHARTTRVQLWAAAGYVALLLALFARPLLALVLLAAESELHSYVLLVPFISAYLLYLRRKRLPVERNPAWGLTILWVAAGAVAATIAVANPTGPSAVSQSDHLSLIALSFVCFVVAGGFLFQGRRWMKAATFPIAFLVFMIPLPDGLVSSLETASKLASTEAASLLFQVTGTPVVRNGNIFELPNIVIEVAQECSGIRSSIILLITSLLASHLFLKSPWRRAILVGLVIPLGILRNGFRIVAIGLLCVEYGPQMIHNVIHTHGGPVFFAASLVPLFFLLWWLRRGEAPGEQVERPGRGAQISDG